MTEYSMKVSVREDMRKSHVKDLLKRGYIPAIMYGKINLPLEIPLKEMQRALHGGKNAILNLDVKGEGGPYKVMVRELQLNPLTRNVIHADLQQISMKDKVHATVPIHLTGKTDGGLAQLVLRELELSCLPASIPNHITVDISGMKPGDTVLAGKLSVPEGTEVLTEPDITVVSILAPQAEEEVPEVPEVTVEEEAGKQEAE